MPETPLQPQVVSKLTTVPPATAPAAGDHLARLLVRRGVIDENQLVYAKRVQAKLVSDRSLVEMLKELRLLTSAELGAALKQEPPDIRLGELLVELGSIRRGELASALAIQQTTGGARKIGDILVEYGFIDEAQLVETLANKLGYPFVVPDFARIDRDLLRQVPLKLFGKNCFLPVARQGNQVLVAFADPLDREDREAADRIFGRHHQTEPDSQDVIVALVRLANKGCHKVGLAGEPDPGLVLPTTAEAQFLGIDEIALAEFEIMLEDRFGLAGADAGTSPVGTSP